MSQQPKRTLQRCPCCAKATEIIVMGKCPKCSSTRELMDEIARLTEENVQWDNLNKDVTSENVHLRHAINAGFETGKKLKADNERLTAQLQFSEICGEYVLEASELVVLRLVGDHFARKEAAPPCGLKCQFYPDCENCVEMPAAPPALTVYFDKDPKSDDDMVIAKDVTPDSHDRRYLINGEVFHRQVADKPSSNAHASVCPNLKPDFTCRLNTRVECKCPACGKAHPKYAPYRNAAPPITEDENDG